MRIKACFFVLFALLLTLLVASSVSAQCYAYPDTTPTDYTFTYGYGCASHGPGCQQCDTINPNGSGSVCTYDWWGEAVDCYYFGPENQSL